MVKEACKLCSFGDFELQDEFDKRAQDYSPRALHEWLTSKGSDVTFANRTLYAHRKHIMHPQDRIVSAVEKRRMDHGVQPAKASHEEFLESLVSLGAAKIAEDPDAVTVDQALKAAKIQVDREKKGQTTNVLVQLFTEGAGEPTVIEGEVREI